MRRMPLTAAVAAALLVAGCNGGAGAAGGSGASSNTLIIAMTAAQLPGLDAGTFESEGWEGERFVGMQLYDGLTKMSLNQDKTGPTIEPDLATSWKVSKDVKTWTFTLRPGVTFHDGTPFNADAAVFGFDRILNPKSKYFNADAAGLIGFYTQSIAGYKKVNDMTFQITTKAPYALLTQDLPFLTFPSPTAVEKLGNKAFGQHPVGTGPFKFSRLISGGSAEFVKNEKYWNGAPTLDKLVLRPIPEATARVSALRSGEVNWIEFPSPDDAASLGKEGYIVKTNPYSHIWPWLFDVTKGPLKDARVRLALNLAINRDQMAKGTLSGFGAPAEQYVPQTDVGYQPSGNVLTYDPVKAKSLLAAAGYPNGFSMTLSYPTSGSGNMVPGPMNEALQADLAKVGVKVKLEPVEWSAMIGDWSAGKMSLGADATNISLGFQPPISWEVYFGSKSVFNVGHYNSPQFDALWSRAQATVDDTARAKIIEQINALLVKDNPWLVVVSDLNPRVITKNVHGFTQPRSVWVDLTHITVS
ncbi:MAG: ABC-type transporter, periplasmic subunit [Frankiales bacterium]|nr:ABC-type transporter, periplasmic subunit [Frankiales bacterium]